MNADCSPAEVPRIEAKERERRAQTKRVTAAPARKRPSRKCHLQYTTYKIDPIKEKNGSTTATTLQQTDRLDDRNAWVALALSPAAPPADATTFEWALNGGGV
jgi:hypothetical protein